MANVLRAQLLAEIEDTIRSYTGNADDPAFVAWVGRAAMLLKRWGPSRSMLIDSHARGAFGVSGMLADSDTTTLLMLLHEARQDLRLNEVGPLSAAIDRGAVLDYFEEVRKVLITARRELFFVDPYLDAEFVSRYLPHVSQGVTIRLLGKKGIAALVPAVELAAQQFNIQVSLRTSSSLHDRFLFIDGARGFHSGASFKDGARLAPTIFTEVTDALGSVLGVYDQMWSAATVHPSPRH